MLQNPVDDRRLYGKTLYSRITMKLEIFSRTIDQLQEAVGDLVLANALVTYQQQMRPELEISGLN